MTGISAIPAAAVPAGVRAEGGEQAYRTALGFEGLLLDKLSEQLVQDGGLGDSPYAASMGEAFTSSLLQGGGLGLAGELYASLRTTAKPAAS